MFTPACFSQASVYNTTKDFTLKLSCFHITAKLLKYIPLVIIIISLAILILMKDSLAATRPHGINLYV